MTQTKLKVMIELTKDLCYTIMVSKSRIRESLYEIHDLDELEEIHEHLKKDVEFVALDERGHRMYTAGLNGWLKAE